MDQRGGLILADQRGDRSADLPFATPHGSGEYPPRPPERSVSKWDDIKNAPRGKCRLRTAVSAIIVGVDAASSYNELGATRIVNHTYSSVI